MKTRKILIAIIVIILFFLLVSLLGKMNFYTRYKQTAYPVFQNYVDTCSQNYFNGQGSVESNGCQKNYGYGYPYANQQRIYYYGPTNYSFR